MGDSIVQFERLKDVVLLVVGCIWYLVWWCGRVVALVGVRAGILNRGK